MGGISRGTLQFIGYKAITSDMAEIMKARCAIYKWTRLDVVRNGEWRFECQLDYDKLMALIPLECTAVRNTLKKRKQFMSRNPAVLDKTTV